jgi:hypothetical protein
MFGPSAFLLNHLQGVYGEWRDDEDEYFDEIDDFLDDIDAVQSVSSPAAVPIKILSREGCCPICLDDVGDTGGQSLKCGHRFCNECLSSYLLHQIKSREVKKCQVRFFVDLMSEIVIPHYKLLFIILGFRA